MVVDEDDLAEAVVVQTEHHVDERLADDVVADDARSRHPEVVVGVRAELHRRQAERRRSAVAVAMNRRTPSTIWLQNSVSVPDGR